MDGNWINTRQAGGHNEWPAFLRELPNDEVGTPAYAGGWPGPAERRGGRRLEGERQGCSPGGGGDGSIMCGEAGCLHCGFTSATSHPLLETIISCSIIQMIFTRANYTGPRPAEKMAWVFYCCTHRQESAPAEAVQVGVETFGCTCFFSGSVPMKSHKGCCKLYTMVSAFVLTFLLCLFSFGCHSIPVKHFPCLLLQHLHKLISLRWQICPQISFFCTVARWSSLQGKCLHLSLHAHHLGAVQMDTKFTEILCHHFVLAPLWCAPQTDGAKPINPPSLFIATFPTTLRQHQTGKSKKEVFELIIIKVIDQNKCASLGRVCYLHVYHKQQLNNNVLFFHLQWTPPFFYILNHNLIC